MKPNLEICPKCLGAKDVMTPRLKGKGFEYKTCNLCNGEGLVNKELSDDFLLSINEENIEIDD